MSHYEAHLESAPVLPDDFQVEYSRLPINDSQGQAAEICAPPSQAPQVSLSDPRLQHVWVCSAVLECIQHKFLAISLIRNLLQCCTMNSRWSPLKSLSMTLKDKLSRSVLLHRKQLNCISVIHDCNLFEFFSPVLECTQLQSLAMILIWNQNQCR